MDVESFIISAVVTIVLLCVAFGTRALIRKHRKKQGTFIDIQKKSKILKNSMLVLIIITFGIGIYSVLLPKYHYSYWLDGANPVPQMANSSLRQYAGRVRGSTVKDLLSYVDTLNAQQVFPENIVIIMFKKINDNTFYTVDMKDENQDGYYDTISISLGYNAKAEDVKKMANEIIAGKIDAVLYYNNEKIDSEIDIDSNNSYIVTAEDTDNDNFWDSIYIEGKTDEILSLFYQSKYGKILKEIDKTTSILSLLYKYRHSDFQKTIENIDHMKIFLYGEQIRNYSILNKIEKPFKEIEAHSYVDKNQYYETITINSTADNLTLNELIFLGHALDLEFYGAILLFVIIVMINLIGIMIYYILDIPNLKNSDKVIIDVENIVYLLISIWIFVIFSDSVFYHGVYLGNATMLEILRGIWIIDILALLITFTNIIIKNKKESKRNNSKEEEYS